MPFTPLQQSKASAPTASGFTPIGGPSASSNTSESSEDVGFVKGAVRDLVSPAARVAATVRNTAMNIPNVFKNPKVPYAPGETIAEHTKRAQPELDQTMDKPLKLGGYLGSFKPLGRSDQTGVQQIKDAAGVGIGGAVNYLDAGIPGALKTGAKGLIKGAVIQGAKDLAREGAVIGAGSALSNSLQDNKGAGETMLDTLIGTILGGVTGGIAGGATAGIGAATKPIQEEFVKKTEKFFDEKVAGKITDLYNRAFPAFRKDLAAGPEKYQQNQVNGVRTIVENLPKDPETGKTVIPKNREEAFTALKDAKNKMYSAYSKLASGGNGKNEVESGILDGVVGIFKDFGQKLNGSNLLPETKSQIISRMKWLDNLGDLSPEGIQKAMEQLNEGVGSVFSVGAESRKGAVDLQFSLALRDMLDGVLEKTEGPGYKELRKKFASLKAVEKNFESANMKYFNKTGGKLGDQLIDPVAYGEMMAGAMTMNPVVMAKGLAIKGAKEAYKYLNSPDRAVSSMFGTVDDIYNQAARDLGEYAGREAATVPEAGLKEKAIKGIANAIRKGKEYVQGPLDNGAVRQTVNDIEASMSKKYPNTTFSIYEYPKEIELSSIFKPKEMRGTGEGRRAMNDLIKIADHQGKAIRVKPSNDLDKEVSVESIRKFYKSLGFAEDQNGYMIYRPK